MKKILTLIAILFVLSMHVLPISYVFIHLDHICEEGHHCEVCLNIYAICSNALSKIKNFIFVKNNALFNLFFILILASITTNKNILTHLYTPIRLKVKLII